MKKIILQLLVFILFTINLNAQNVVSDSVDIFDLSLEELMNISIVSASRVEESSFEAPTTSFVITRQEIINSGSRNLPEALRLCPGVIVKQSAEGVYDIGIRGFDNLPAYNYINNNKTILVMIDNRPVFDYFNGGTYWQNLPVEIVEIDRIEIVYGPSAPLYGPNAVLGVINIITSRGSDKEILARGYLQAGTVGNISAQTYLNYNLSEKIAVRGSYNYFASNRNQVDFYYNGSDQFVNSPSDIQSGLTTESMQEVFYNPEMALRKSSGNFNLDYEVNEKVNFTVGTGINHSEALYPIVTMSAATPMINDSYFAFVNANIHGFSFLGSLLSGHQGLHGKYDLYSYDYNNLDLYIDYNWTISKNFSIRPAVNYQRAMVNDLPYTEGSTKPGLFNNKASNYNAAASIKADYKTKKLRLIAAIRTDKFQYPTELYPAYQFAFNYYLDENNMIRLNWSRSNGGAFMAETFTDYVIFQIPSFGGNPGLTATLEGNRERKLLTNELQEIGYRTSIGSNLQFDLSLFRQTGSNFTASVNQDPEFDPMSNTVTIRSLYQNLSLNAEQLGATFSANIIGFNDLIHFKPFITFQKTNLKNYSPYYQTAGNNTDDNIDNTEDVEGTTTPSTYGGFYLNVLPSDKFSLNLNGYSFGSFESLTISSVDQMTGVVSDKPESHIESKFILNAVFNVKLSKGFQVFLNGRNIFNTNNREMFGTSMVGSCYLAGINVTL